MLFRIITGIYWRYFRSPEAYARHIGVKIGHDCLINTRNWSSEPYLVTIGNHVQITHDVYIHTHGGGNVVRCKYPDFDLFGKACVFFRLQECIKRRITDCNMIVLN